LVTPYPLKPGLTLRARADSSVVIGLDLRAVSESWRRQVSISEEPDSCALAR